MNANKVCPVTNQSHSNHIPDDEEEELIKIF